MKGSPNPANPEKLAALCLSAGFDISEQQCQGLTTYLNLLMQWNKVMNLVGSRTWEDALCDLIMDSLHLAHFLSAQFGQSAPHGSTSQNAHPSPAEPVQPPAEAQPGSLCSGKLWSGIAQPQIWDFGAGAGLPGIPLRMFWQEGEYWLVEAREKRALFLGTVLARHPLPQTKVFQGRVEAFMHRQTRPAPLPPASSAQSAPHASPHTTKAPVPQPAHLVLSRAFMPWEQMLPLVRPYLAQKGHVLFLMQHPLQPQDLAETPWSLTASCAYPVLLSNGSQSATRYFNLVQTMEAQ